MSLWKKSKAGRYADAVFELLSSVNHQVLDIQEKVVALEADLRTLTRDVSSVRQIASRSFDGVGTLAAYVLQMRHLEEYAATMQDRAPLVTVRIATYNRAQTLVETALASVLAQTYQHFEVIVVGDHCSDDTAERIRALGDDRITFVNLPARTPYPQDRIKKWQVIGAHAMNLGADMARGRWIAPLDDDDMFTPDHLETLLNLALDESCEFAYGAMRRLNLVTGQEDMVWSSPPDFGSVSLNGAVYMKLLDPFFKYDFNSWVLDEVADWTMVRRMLEAGVRVATTEKIVGEIKMIPAGHDKKDY